MDAAGRGGDAEPRQVVVDVDTGIDDALALLLLLAADAAGEIRLRAITCVGGNAGLANVCRNTLRLLSAANRLDVPVYAGAERPLIADGPEKSTYHGADGFGDLDESVVPPLPRPVEDLLQKEHAVVALNRIVSENKGRVTLVCLAPLTNVALATRTYSAFAEDLQELHIMGGNSRGDGNTTPCAEFNFYTDPEAAHIVLGSVACPVQITPWEPCAGHPIESDWRFDELPGLGGGAALEFITAAQLSIQKPKQGARRAAWVCCDELAVAALLRPALAVRAHLRHVTVELAGGRTRGQMVPACVRWTGVCEPDCAGPACSKGPQPRLPMRIIDAFNVDAFKDLLSWAAPRWTRP